MTTIRSDFWHHLGCQQLCLMVCGLLRQAVHLGLQLVGMLGSLLLLSLKLRLQLLLLLSPGRLLPVQLTFSLLSMACKTRVSVDNI